jgi:hypothetical protein
MSVLPFSGPARPLSNADTVAAAATLGCDPHAVTAVLTVETGGTGGFLSDGSGRPKILFEAGAFGAATGHRWDSSHPNISCTGTNWSLYEGGAAEYDRLADAIALDREAALASASWGLFQVMGYNAVGLGYADIETYVSDMAQSEAAQLDAFVRFVQTNGLAGDLAGNEWAAFARGYNGPLYATNHYDTRLAQAYVLAGGEEPLLAVGSSGPQVIAAQTALNAHNTKVKINADGSFGPATALAVRVFQASAHLPVDGVIGAMTGAALGLSAAK